MSTAPTPSPAASGGLEQNVAGLLCYSPVGIICDIIWLVAEPYKNNKFIRFHAFQSLFLCAALFCLFFGLWIIGMVLGFIAGPLALIIFPLELLLFFGACALCIFMMIKAYGNSTTQLPIIGPMAAKQAGL